MQKTTLAKLWKRRPSHRTFGTHTAGMVCRHWSCRAERGKVDLQVLEALVGPSGQPWESTQAAPPPRLAPMDYLGCSGSLAIPSEF
ncbi:hypothetical protein CapIbe_020185 [Capra ibex]